MEDQPEDDYAVSIIEKSVEILDDFNKSIGSYNDQSDFTKIVSNLCDKNEELNESTMEAVSKISTKFGDNGRALANVLNNVV